MRTPLAVVSMMLLAACPSPDPAPSGSAVADAYLTIVDSMRSHVLECSGSTWEEGEDFTTMADGLQASVDAGKLVIDLAALQACAASVASFGCAETFWAWDEPACLEEFGKSAAGTVAPGDDCADDLECAGGFCDFTLGTCPGSCVAHAGAMESCSTLPCAEGLKCVTLVDPAGDYCVAKEVIAAGNPCGWPDVCAPGTSCLWDVAAGDDLCKAPLAQGAACTATQQCDAPLLCLGPPGGGKCVTLSPIGEACGPTAGCNPYFDYCDPGSNLCAPFPVAGQTCAASGRCAGAAWCDPADDQCKPLPTLGQECAAAGKCAAGSYCDTRIATPVCAAIPGAGGDCSITASLYSVPDCQPGLFCQRDTYYQPTTCAVRVAAAGTCIGRALDECVDGLFCDHVPGSSGTCQPRRPAGASCVDERGCVDGLMCSDLCTVQSCWY